MERDALFSVKDKIAVVTGGSRGIGEMIATALAVNGAKVYITARDKSACEATAGRISARVDKSRYNAEGEPCVAIGADLSSYTGVDTFVSQLTAFGVNHVDVLVNNAGASWGEPLETHPEHAWDKLYSINVKAPFRLIQQLLPLLKVNATRDSPSRIINIGSINGMSVPMLDTFSYASTKAAVHHLTRMLSSKLADSFICVNAIAPGPFPSKMTKHMLETMHDAIEGAVPLKRIGNPQDMAGVTLLLSSPAGAYITGTVIPVDGGIIVKPSL
eukprot:m.147098 g.147098  ORF g.147098 m.147098 type:complete len:272 (-) comp14160_c0_seq7:3047-3862(-)